jgi:hypothetical protein
MLTALRPNYAARAYTHAKCGVQISISFVIKLASDEHDEVRAGHGRTLSQIKYFKLFFVVNDKKHNVKTDIYGSTLKTINY